MSGEPRERLKIAVVQPELAVGEVDANLRRLSSLARAAAREHDPQVLLLPEAMTSPNMFAPRMYAVPRPIDGEPLRFLLGLARELGCTVGGGFLANRGADTRHTYAMVEPHGAVHLHDKDQPSMWENNYYVGGRDDGLFTTDFGTVGCAMGFEWGRSRTARRLRGKVEAVLGGSCWWSAPFNWWVLGPLNPREHTYNVCMAREAPRRLARMVGAPCAVAQHVGEVESRTPMVPGVRWRTVMVGESQIVERDGSVVARLGYDEGEGYVGGEVGLGAPRPLEPIPAGFWHHPMTAIVQAIWYYQNLHGRLMYRRRRRRDHIPAALDLPNYLEIEAEPEASAPAENRIALTPK